MKFNRFNKTFLEYCVIEPELKSEKTKDIVFIHGFATDGRSWTYYIDKDKENRLHILNLPTCGNLKYPINEINISKFALTIVDYINSLKRKDIAIIGHSLGAAISAIVYYYLEDKSKVSKMVLMSPYSAYSIPKVIDKIFMANIKNESHFYKLQEHIFYDYKKTLKEIDNPIYYPETMDFFKRNQKYLRILMVQMFTPLTFALINKAFKNIKCDFCLMLADHDRFVNNDVLLSFFRKYYINIKALIYKNCGHGFFIEEPQKFFEDIKKFIG